MRFRLVYTLEYDVDPEHLEASYGTIVPAECLEIDVANANQDPMLTLQLATEYEGATGAGGGSLTITGEIVDDQKGCICPRFSDTGGMRIGDLCCPVHGVDGTEPLDGPDDRGEPPAC